MITAEPEFHLNFKESQAHKLKVELQLLYVHKNMAWFKYSIWYHLFSNMTYFILEPV